MIHLFLVACALAQDPPPGFGPEAPATGAGYESRFETRTSAKDENVTGGTGSTLNEGMHVISENRWLSTWTRKAGDTLQFEANVRWTDDERTDPNRWTLMRMAVTYSSERSRVVAGDFSGSFSPFALSLSLRGVQVEGRWDGLRGQLLVGTNKPDWRSQFEKVKNEPADRIFAGARVEIEPREGLRAGLSVVHAKDILSTADVQVGLLGVRNLLAAVDADWEVSETVSVRGEAAWSDYDSDFESSSGAQTAWAIRGEWQWRPENLDIVFGFERVEPGFLTAGGSAIADRETGRGRVSWIPSPVVEIGAGYVARRDNLEGQLPETTRTTEPEASLRFPDAFGVPGLQVRAVHRVLRIRSDTGAKDSDTRVTEAAVEALVSGISGGISLGLRMTDDRTPADNDSRADVWSLSIGLPLDWLARSGTLALRVGRERTKEFVSGKLHETDTASAGATLQVTERVSTAFGFEWAGRRPDNFPEDDQENRGARAQVTYTFAAPTEASITVSFDRRDFEFEGAGSIKNYRETVWLVTLWWAN